MTIVVAHRGASRRAPENTMEAFRLAVELGADAIELDVHLTADGQLAVIHDAALERTTDRAGVVAELTMDEIRAADAGWAFTPPDGTGTPGRGRGHTVPTLPEVLEWLPAGVGLAVELKARAAADAAVAAVAGSGVHRSGAASIISFDELAIERVRELDPSIPTGYLLVPTQPIEPALAWAQLHGHLAVHPWEGDLRPDPKATVIRAQSYGRQLGCYVVNDPERMLEIARAGLWGFVTDVPDVARATLSSR